MPQKVLMAVPNYYTSVFQVGSHHYARAFEELGFKILFISNPISPFHKIFANNLQLKNREAIHKAGGKKTGNILFYVPQALFTPYNKPILSSSFVINNWQRFTFPNLLNYIKQKGFNEVEILWFDSPLFGFLLDKVKYKTSILRIADYSKGFSAVSQNQFDKEIEMANRVDKIVYSAKNLKDKYSEIEDKSKMVYVPNGIDLAFFEKADKIFPAEFESIPEPRVIYIGAIHEWFDVDLVYHSAQNLPAYSFVIIGPEQKDLSKLRSLTNIYLLGQKPYNRVPQFLSHSQVGIIPFDVTNHPDLINSINPIKIYEYLACNLTVVSMKWEEIEDLNELICLADNHDAFIDGVKNYSAFKSDPEKCLRFVKENQWIEKLKHLLFF
ncbi:glycosyltransferase family protein [Desulfoglaeba alkanexedens]|uniref:Glycosyltransferase family 1 protein n=1 Tax=Desulfoglaeba alkanexedens ALDC TaxID=980445 RepID=A0A4P8KZJ2_9BACT|nr:glycosyltransferase [Desulfoglaeba alkanexedens]QCQ20830.1 glycosyltransferase family 1 protein [Desulfoglaeba alkanexedens ALDC]